MNFAQMLGAPVTPLGAKPPRTRQEHLKEVHKLTRERHIDKYRDVLPNRFTTRDLVANFDKDLTQAGKICRRLQKAGVVEQVGFKRPKDAQRPFMVWKWLIPRRSK